MTILDNIALENPSLIGKFVPYNPERVTDEKFKQKIKSLLQSDSSLETKRSELQALFPETGQIMKYTLGDLGLPVVLLLDEFGKPLNNTSVSTLSYIAGTGNSIKTAISKIEDYNIKNAIDNLNRNPMPVVEQKFSRFYENYFSESINFMGINPEFGSKRFIGSKSISEPEACDFTYKYDISVDNSLDIKELVFSRIIKKDDDILSSLYINKDFLNLTFLKPLLEKQTLFRADFNNSDGNLNTLEVPSYNLNLKTSDYNEIIDFLHSNSLFMENTSGKKFIQSELKSLYEKFTIYGVLFNVGISEILQKSDMLSKGIDTIKEGSVNLDYRPLLNDIVRNLKN